MALSLKSLVTTKNTNPPVIVLYGVDGVGKTTLASEFPDPVYLPTEGERAPSGVELLTPGIVTSYGELLDVIEELLTQEHDRKTLIVDSLDGLEPLVWAETCRRLGVSSIEEPGFGKGYVEADVEWSEYLAAVSALARSGVTVVQLAHPDIVRFDSPVTDPYSRYTIKLHKRANAMVRERADIVAFMDYRVSIKEKEVGRQQKVAHGEGGKERQIHLEERAGFQAKNRYDGMPDRISYKIGKGYEEMSKHFPEPTGVTTDAQAA